MKLNAAINGIISLENPATKKSDFLIFKSKDKTLNCNVIYIISKKGLTIISEILVTHLNYKCAYNLLITVGGDYLSESKPFIKLTKKYKLYITENGQMELHKNDVKFVENINFVKQYGSVFYCNNTVFIGNVIFYFDGKSLFSGRFNINLD
jgi:hypothetical protein